MKFLSVKGVTTKTSKEDLLHFHIILLELLSCHSIFLEAILQHALSRHDYYTTKQSGIEAHKEMHLHISRYTIRDYVLFSNYKLASERLTQLQLFHG
jgi:hypothetical protein